VKLHLIAFDEGAKSLDLSTMQFNFSALYFRTIRPAF